MILKWGEKDDRVSCAHDILVNVGNILHIVNKQICIFAHVPNESCSECYDSLFSLIKRDKYFLRLNKISAFE